MQLWPMWHAFSVANHHIVPTRYSPRVHTKAWSSIIVTFGGSRPRLGAAGWLGILVAHARIHIEVGLGTVETMQASQNGHAEFATQNSVIRTNGHDDAVRYFRYSILSKRVLNLLSIHLRSVFDHASCLAAAPWYLVLGLVNSLLAILSTFW